MVVSSGAILLTLAGNIELVVAIFYTFPVGQLKVFSLSHLELKEENTWHWRRKGPGQGGFKMANKHQVRQLWGLVLH